MPDELVNRRYYEPKNAGREARHMEYLTKFREYRQKASSGGVEPSPEKPDKTE